MEMGDIRGKIVWGMGSVACICIIGGACAVFSNVYDWGIEMR